MEAMQKLLERIVASGAGSIRIEAVSNFFIWGTVFVLFAALSRYCLQNWEEEIEDLPVAKIGFWASLVFSLMILGEVAECIAAFIYPEYWALRLVM